MKTKSDINTVVFSPKKHNIEFSISELRQIVLDFRALAHVERQQIIELLNKEKTLNVTDIYLRLRLEQSVTSQHLSMLRRAQIVKQQRSGKVILYSLNQEKIETIKTLVQSLNVVL